jgi:hypothetical protein
MEVIEIYKRAIEKSESNLLKEVFAPRRAGSPMNSYRHVWVKNLSFDWSTYPHAPVRSTNP